jgi:putative isomerase
MFLMARNHPNMWMSNCCLYLTLGAVLLLMFSNETRAQSPKPQFVYTGELKMDISKVPFSRFGSYMSISDMRDFPSTSKREGVYLRDLHHDGEPSFRLEIVNNGKAIPFTVVAKPTRLTFVSNLGDVEICFQGPDRIRLRGKGVGFRLVAEEGSWTLPQGPSRWEVNNSAAKYMLLPVKGAIHMDSPWNGTGSDRVVATFEGPNGAGPFEAEVDTYVSVWEIHNSEGTFETAHDRERQAYTAWLRKMPPVGIEFGKGAELAAYISWESVVQPSGNLRRPAMLMSKNWMTALWSWDQCFNAMAMSLVDPELAWDQFMLPIDVQNRYGVFPDKWDAASMVWEYSKPPVHGWALAWMLRHHQFEDRMHLADVYEPLVKWTNWYFKYRDVNQNGFPEYRHGDDSGWDNSTVMLTGVPVETPELDAYLVLQMDTLAKLAKALGKEGEGREWQERSNKLLHSMIQRFWVGGRFVAYRASDGESIDSDSLLLFMPLILGNRLPREIQTKMVESLTRQGRYLTENGLSTEALTSSRYTPDGYWRGPIWAPSTMILAEGLDDIGQRKLADKIRAAFCRMAQEHGMSENFNALTGDGLRDSAYTWTSSVYLIFANKLLIEDSSSQLSVTRVK